MFSSRRLVVSAVAAVVALGATLLVVLALTGDPEGAADTRVVQPGAPGQSGRTLSPEELASLAPPAHNAADTRFIQRMIPHHAQAIDMSRMAPTHGASESIQVLAARIINAQQDEIRTMQTWLGNRDLPVPPDARQGEHCGSCERCIEICPTQAIRGPYRLDARRCISYLTIEHKSAIPEELRPLIGNRVYGCDDCQLVCPWNRFAQPSTEADFETRNGLDRASLVELFGWTESEFDERLQGSPIRRIGYERWLRNLAVGLGNAPTSPAVVEALRARASHSSELVREHVRWALARHGTVAA